MSQPKAQLGFVSESSEQSPYNSQNDEQMDHSSPLDKDYTLDSDDFVQRELEKSIPRSSDADECLYGETPPKKPSHEEVKRPIVSSLSKARVEALLLQPKPKEDRTG